MIRAFIVDDEEVAREGIRLLLEQEPDIDVVGEAQDGIQAVDEIKRLHPDLVFLDVQMPALDGFGVLQHVAPLRVPAVIFVTAHDQYAVEAFETQAVDYLLKPFTDGRLQRALDRARRVLLRPDHPEHDQHAAIQDLESDSKSASKQSAAYLRLLTVRTGRHLRLLKVSEIDWIDSASNYVEVHAGGHSHLIRMTLSELEAKLDPECFVRIHRTTIVNIDRVQELDLVEHGDVDIKLRDGTALRWSRRYRDRLVRIVPV